MTQELQSIMAEANQKTHKTRNKKKFTELGDMKTAGQNGRKVICPNCLLENFYHQKYQKLSVEVDGIFQHLSHQSCDRGSLTSSQSDVSKKWMTF